VAPRAPEHIRNHSGNAVGSEDCEAQVGIADFEAGDLPAKLRRESREAGQTKT
jgi:hypothetical protein